MSSLCSPPILTSKRLKVSLSCLIVVIRFVNHSCEPNLRTMGVMIDEVDTKLHKIALFTTKVVKKGQELLFDYEGAINGPFDVGDDVNKVNNGRNRKEANDMNCRCDSESCRGVVKL